MPAAHSAKSAGADQLQLTNVAGRAMAEPDFDRAKVESIKQAIQDGQYPLNPRKIAESFHAIEQMIRE
jgi:negative regulator of flagellin synthesis FlgM